MISNSVVEKIIHNVESDNLEGGVEKEAKHSEDAFHEDEELEEDRHSGVKLPSGSKPMTQYKDPAVDHEVSERLHSDVVRVYI